MISTPNPFFDLKNLTLPSPNPGLITLSIQAFQLTDCDPPLQQFKLFNWLIVLWASSMEALQGGLSHSQMMDDFPHSLRLRASHEGGVFAGDLGELVREFLEVCIHQLLCIRELYPPGQLAYVCLSIAS